ncbi:hypothetical protein WN48_06865 [Eufriesea mexicana]|uniref:Uncharacterized protein n=1 Tax=Eufriesea mexicana TaxID=516756 RepID=A0A310SQR8_9HYME|nr:hypothetical protein WN48_06865 [Eufriesea mexicana]
MEKDYRALESSLEKLELTASNEELESRFTETSPLAVYKEPQVKLSTMQWPTIWGCNEAWTSSCDAFNAAVHDNPRFHDAQKLIYLRSCPTGMAAEGIGSLEATRAQYSVAWNLLERLYSARCVVFQ